MNNEDVELIWNEDKGDLDESGSTGGDKESDSEYSLKVEPSRFASGMDLECLGKAKSRMTPSFVAGTDGKMMLIWTKLGITGKESVYFLSMLEYAVLWCSSVTS